MPRLDRPPGETGGVHERAQPGPARVREHFQSVPHQDAVLAGERHDVRHGREGHVIEEMQRHVGRPPERGHERLRQLECDSRSAQVVVLVRAVGPARVEHRRGGRKLVPRDVVVGDDDLPALGAGRAHRVNGADAAVARDDQPRVQAAGLREPGGTEVISVPQAMGHEGVRVTARAPQHPRQERRRALPVHVVVPVHEDGCARAHGAGKQVYSRAHVGPATRVRQTLQVGTQEGLGDVRRGEAALHQDGGEGLGNPELGGERRHEAGIRALCDGPAGNHSLA